MVAAAHWAATAAGVEILEAGGNAVDAAVAAGFALGVAEPSGSGLGGMAHLVVHLEASGRTLAVLGPCRAPRREPGTKPAATDNLVGYSTIAIPTQPGVLGYVLERYGTMPLQEVLLPAIALARDGCVVSPFQHQLAANVLDSLQQGTAGAFFLDEHGRPPEPGFALRQLVLARTLERLARVGVGDFFHGEIARSIVRDMRRNGGLVDQADLQSVATPLETAPLAGETFHGTAYALPPPGGGATLLQQLLLFERLAPPTFVPDSPAGAALFAAIARRAEIDRRARPAPPVERGTSAPPAVLAGDDLDRNANLIRRELDAGSETSHLSVMDRFGNAVALTQSINHAYGARCAAPDLGFAYNCYLGDLNTTDPAHPYYLRPGAAARSNATPTIVVRNGQPTIAIGAAGERRMLSVLLQVLVRLRDHSPYAAVAAPRMFCSQSGTASLEAARWDAAVVEHLRRQGLKINRWDDWAFKAGAVQLAVAGGDGFEGAADPRRDGAAGGPDR
ncbi:MAG: gamma-glutamyltransferase [Deltaproteobacteria bacterium]|nr:gamma-glutamyltransferase [Deltaproteobacteria bacterium]